MAGWWSRGQDILQTRPDSIDLFILCWNFSVVFGKTKINEKEAGIDPFSDAFLAGTINFG